MTILLEGGALMDIRAGDTLVMKKQHPGCGSREMLVMRSGADFRLCCKGCGHTFMTARSKCEKNIKAVVRPTDIKDNTFGGNGNDA